MYSALIDFPKKAPSLSLTDIFKNDDVENLKLRMDANQDLPKLLVKVPFCGKSVATGTVAAAIHYRALKCLKLLPMNSDTYGAKPGAQSAGHFACENQWEPGLRILMDRRMPLNTFDEFSKTPLAYVAEHENIRMLKMFLQYFELNNLKESGLKNVALANEGSLDFLAYCVEIKRTVMIETCNFAMKKGFVSQHDVLNAIKRWKMKYPEEKMPLFLKTFDTSFTLQGQNEITNIFSPLVPESKFADITLPNSIPVYKEIIKLNRLCDIVKADTQPLPITADSFNYTDTRILSQYPHELSDPNKTYMIDCFSQCHILRSYFTGFLEKMMVVVDGYYAPGKDISSEIWRGFGTVLAHVGFNGCHYHFDKPLHPLIYAILTFSDAQQLEFIDINDIEQYTLIMHKKSLIKARREGLVPFLKGDQQFIKMYDEKLNYYWANEYRKYKKQLVLIYEGFYNINGSSRSKVHQINYRKKDYSDRNNCFQMFLHKVMKMKVPTLRMWFEGIQHVNKLFEEPWNIISHLIFKPYVRENDGGTLRVNQFINGFKDWLIKQKKKVKIGFLAILMGNRVFLPIESNFKTIYVISDKEKILVPRIIVPTQEAVIPIMDSYEEIEALVSDLLKTGNVIYDSRENIFNGLFPLTI